MKRCEIGSIWIFTEALTAANGTLQVCLKNGRLSNNKNTQKNHLGEQLRWKSKPFPLENVYRKNWNIADCIETRIQISVESKITSENEAKVINYCAKAETIWIGRSGSSLNGMPEDTLKKDNGKRKLIAGTSKWPIN